MEALAKMPKNQINFTPLELIIVISVVMIAMILAMSVSVWVNQDFIISLTEQLIIGLVTGIVTGLVVSIALKRAKV
jgi:membrane protein YdbS with pleckstrin-like domain